MKTKFTPEVVDRVCQLIEEENYSQKQICKLIDVSERVFIDWKVRYPQFVKQMENAQMKWFEKLKVNARRSLNTLVTGFEAEDVREVYDKNGKLIEKVKTKKTVKPDTAAVIFSLSNVDKGNFQNRQNTDVTTNGENVNTVTFVTLKGDEDIQDQLKKLKQ